MEGALSARWFSALHNWMGCRTMKARDNEPRNPPPPSRLHSKQAAIFFIALAALVLILVVGLWLVDRKWHILTVSTILLLLT